MENEENLALTDYLTLTIFVGANFVINANIFGKKRILITILPKIFAFFRCYAMIQVGGCSR